MDSERPRGVPVEIQAASAIDHARQTLSWAEHRCVPTDCLIARVGQLLSESDPTEVVSTLEERDLTHEQSRSLGKAIGGLLSDVDVVRGVDKGAYDRRIGRLLRMLPEELSCPLAADCVAHERKSRRTAGLRCLRLASGDGELHGHLASCFERHGDVRVLKALLSEPMRPEGVLPERMLVAFADDEYWEMRVVEACLRADRDSGLRYVDSYPHAFAWAAGRSGDSELVPAVSRCLEVADEKWRVVGIVAWAYGKLGASGELARLHDVLDEMACEWRMGP